jgi:ABC-type lipoprotein release transport system permease subunit
MLFSITAYSFLGFYNGFTNYIGAESNIVAVYGTTGSTPLTGIVPLSLTDKISSVNGVLACSPEVIAPVVIDGKSVFIRGILPEDISKLNNLTVTEGEPLYLTDVDCAVVGKGLSEKLNLKPGDKITAYSVLSEKYADLQIKGVYESGSPIDDEALVPIYVGQWLRSLTYDQVSVIRAKIDPNQVSANQLYQVIAKEASPSGTPQPETPKGDTEKQLEGLISLTQTNFNIQSVGIDQAQNFMKSYLSRYGVSKDTLIIISIVVLVFASGTAACALTLFLNQHEHEIGVLRSLGASAKTVKTDLLIKLLAWSLVASTLGTVLSAAVLLVFQRIGYLQVLSHGIVFQLDPVIAAANFILISALVAVSIARSEMKQ